MASMRPSYWVPPIAWMALIVGLSSDTGSAEHTGALLRPLLGWVWPTATPLQFEALHGLVRKAGHLVEYSVLAVLWYRAFRGGRHWDPRPAGWGALALSIGWAVVDETHQSFVASRTASGADVVIDSAGAAAAVLIARAGWRVAETATTILLWAAALGGALLIAVHLALGLSGGLLWLTTPAAAVALLVLHCRRRPSAGA
jgi:VanZ family protein